MTDLLTVRDVRALLKVDRITVYRMLQDGRLKGVKIGQQWRFQPDEIDRLLGIDQAGSESEPVDIQSGFPTHCVQTIQDLFSEVSQISALVVDMQGNPLTQVSHPTRFCQILLSSPSGESACRLSWQSFAHDSAPVNGVPGSKFFTCLAGLQYIGAPVMDRDTQIGVFLAGQFYWQSPDPREEAERIRRLAASYDVPLNDLQDAARSIPVIPPDQHARAESWPFIAARAVQSILQERICFIERLQQIANLTQL